MKYENYYETLTESQKIKWEDKKGPIIYKDWYEMISKNLDIETAGALLLAILFYDCTGGTKSIPSKYMKLLKKDPTAMVLLDTYIPATAAASRQWINRHKLSKSKPTEEEETEDTAMIKLALEYAKKVKAKEEKRAKEKTPKNKQVSEENEHKDPEPATNTDNNSENGDDDLPF